MTGPEPAVVILLAGAVPAGGGDRLVWYFGAGYRRWRALEAAGPAAPVGDLVNAVAARLTPDTAIGDAMALIVAAALRLTWLLAELLISAILYSFRWVRPES